MLLEWISSQWHADSPVVGPEYIGGRHWAFLAAEAALASEERLVADAERAKQKAIVKQQREESAALEQARLEHEAAEAIREEEEARKRKNREKKEIQKERAKLRSIASDVAVGEASEAVDKLCGSLSVSELQILCDTLSRFPNDARKRTAVLQDAIAEVERKEAESRKDLSARLAALSCDVPSANAEPWSEEELRMLEKALVKFPMGTARRWEQISAYLGTRTVEEVVKMVKVHMSRGDTLLQRDNQGLQIAKKRQGNLSIKDAATQRAEVLTDVQMNLKGEAAARFAGEATGTTEAEGDRWTQVQELALVKALKIFGKELGAERWMRVAEAVPGKSKAECLKRFKEIRETFRNNKSSTATDN